MPPRYAYWTLIVEGKPTAFRAQNRDDLLPTMRQLQSRHPDTVMMWFARGRLWASPEEAQAGAGRRGDRRPSDWRPGGEHRDPRARFAISRDEKRRRFSARLERDRREGRTGERPWGEDGRDRDRRKGGPENRQGGPGPGSRQGGPGSRQGGGPARRPYRAPGERDTSRTGGGWRGGPGGGPDRERPRGPGGHGKNFRGAGGAGWESGRPSGKGRPPQRRGRKPGSGKPGGGKPGGGRGGRGGGDQE